MIFANNRPTITVSRIEKQMKIIYLTLLLPRMSEDTFQNFNLKFISKFNNFFSVNVLNFPIIIVKFI